MKPGLCQVRRSLAKAWSIGAKEAHTLAIPRGELPRVRPGVGRRGPNRRTEGGGLVTWTVQVLGR